jgi:hypothetical protein
VEERASWRSDRLDVRLRQGRLDPGHLVAAAVELAWQQAEARAAADAAATGGALRARIASCARAATEASPALARALERAERGVALERARIEARIAQGRFHGGLGTVALHRLHADADGHAVLAPPAFDAARRPTDAAEDAIALAVEIAAAGRRELADAFLAAWAEAADDFELYRLLPLYEPLLLVERAGAAQAERLLCAPRARLRVVAVGGADARLRAAAATSFAREIGAGVLSAAGLRARADAWSQHLALLRRAEAVLDAGRSVVLDAGFASRAMRRAAARSARARGAALLFIECRAPHARSAPSEWEPVSEIEAIDHLMLRGSAGRAIARGYSRPTHTRVSPASNAFGGARPERPERSIG